VNAISVLPFGRRKLFPAAVESCGEVSDIQLDGRSGSSHMHHNIAAPQPYSTSQIAFMPSKFSPPASCVPLCSPARLVPGTCISRYLQPPPHRFGHVTPPNISSTRAVKLPEATVSESLSTHFPPYDHLCQFASRWNYISGRESRTPSTGDHGNAFTSQRLHVSHCWDSMTKPFSGLTLAANK
jgi:hypothetical protein